MTTPSSTVNRLAVITGASAGIGAAFARAFAARGCDVLLVARRLDRLQALATEIEAEFGVKAFPVQADLSAPGAHQLIVDALATHGRHCDILVNNAGYSLAYEFLDTSTQQQSDFVTVLVTSVVTLTHALLPGMVERGFGRIINVASMVAFAPGAPGHTLYPAAKSFIVKMTQSLAAEVGDKSVFVTAICPGQTASDFASANGTKELVSKGGFYEQSAEDVVELAIKSNENGKEVVISGWPNKIAVLLMKLLPDSMMSALIRPQAKKFVLNHKR